MDLPVPRAFRLETDVSSADWIARSVKPWGADRVRLWSFLPDSFERYARIASPAHDGRAETSDAWVLGVLARLLAPFTDTPDRCWLGAWDGWGSWGPGSSATLVAFRGRRLRLGRGPRIRRSIRRSLERQTAPQREELDAIPKLRIPQRAYFLFSCRVTDVPSFAIGGFPEAPSLWWPEDRAWCVAREVDGPETFVGASAACMASIVASSEIEATEVTADVPLGPGAG